MATVVFRGDAKEVAQVSTATPANVEVNDVFTLTINGKTVSFTATANTVANVTAGLNTAWNASTEPEFSEITAVDSTTCVTLTADTAGYPFTVTGSATEGGVANTQTLVVANTVVASGPSCVSVASNWSGGSLPANGDTVVFEYGDVDALYGLDALAGIVVDKIVHSNSFTGDVGLPRENANGYIEYRERYFKVGFNTADLGLGEGDGTGRFMLNAANSDAPVINIYNSGASEETGIPAVLVTDTGANSVVNINRGDVGIAFFAGEVASVSDLNVGYIDNVTGDSTVRCGSGCTLTTIDKSGGDLAIETNATTINQDGGTTAFRGAATLTTLNLNGGTFYDESSGTITTTTILADAIYDKRRSMVGKTMTNVSVYKGAQFYDPMGTVTLTNGVDFQKCRLSDVTIVRPPHRTWTESAI